MSKFLYRSYVALGDSLTEGLGDHEFEENRHGKGWADRVAGLLSCEAVNAGASFDYANLALRGSNSLAILTSQLEKALTLKPDLVTIMTGANDLVRLPWRRHYIEHLLRGALIRLYATGAHVLLVNVARPAHVSLAKPVVRRSIQMSELLERIAAEFGTPVVDINSAEEFKRLDFWAPDLVHFSHRGHIHIANSVAEALNLELRDGTEVEPGWVRMSAREFGRWVTFDVVPFWSRKVRGITSGHSLLPKHETYQRVVDAPVSHLPHWVDDLDDLSLARVVA